MGHAANVSREAGRLSHLCDLIAFWNKRIRLTELVTARKLWQNHVVPSLTLASHIPTTALTLADLGSGQGFPGLVLAIVTPVHVHLVEADRRKAAFLREAVRELSCNAQVHCARIEHLRPLTADVVTARALAAAPLLVQWGTRHVATSGICIFPKGPELPAELSKIPRCDNRHWTMERTSDSGCFLLIGRPTT